MSRTDGWQPHGTLALGFAEYDLEIARKANTRLRAENDKLRAAVKAVETVRSGLVRQCPWCMCYGDAHESACQGQAALESEQ